MKRNRKKHMVEVSSVDELISFLKDRFGIVLPSNIKLFNTRNHGMHVYAAHLDGANISGLKGFPCYSKKSGLSNYFIQLVGHLATKNIVAVNRRDAVRFITAKPIRKPELVGSISNGYVIVSYKCHILGIGRFINGTIESRLKKLRRKVVVGDISEYIGRRL